jgi:hypothetical protein
MTDHKDKPGLLREQNAELSMYQDYIGQMAIEGDAAAQRAVLEVAVILGTRGGAPQSELFKEAALLSLKTALENNKLPRRAIDKRGLGREAKDFRLAKEWWKEKERGTPREEIVATLTVRHGYDPLDDEGIPKGRNMAPRFSEALRRHGNSGVGHGGLARIDALTELRTEAPSEAEAQRYLALLFEALNEMSLEWAGREPDSRENLTPVSFNYL